MTVIRRSSSGSVCDNNGKCSAKAKKPFKWFDIFLREMLLRVTKAKHLQLSLNENIFFFFVRWNKPVSMILGVIRSSSRAQQV